MNCRNWREVVSCEAPSRTVRAAYMGPYVSGPPGESNEADGGLSPILKYQVQNIKPRLFGYALAYPKGRGITRGATLVDHDKLSWSGSTKYRLIADTRFLITAEESRQRLPRLTRLGLYLPGPFTTPDLRQTLTVIGSLQPPACVYSSWSLTMIVLKYCI